MLRTVLAALALVLPLTALAQQSPVPDRRIVTTTGQDFYGGDIGSIFETTFKNCHQTCYRNPTCAALTYNTRAEACFLKSGVERVEAFDGAISSRMIETPAETRLRAAERLTDLEFLPESTIDRARDLAGTLGTRIAANNSDAASASAAGARSEQSGDFKVAAQNYIAATVLTDSADAWRDLSRVWRKTNGANSAERRRLRREAVYAAVNAYLRSGEDRARATSLNTLARALEQNNQGRATIPALRLSQRLAPRAETEEMLDQALSDYGFRVTGHSVDADAASPRVCVEFSETLASAGVDYAPYLGIEGKDQLAVEIDGERQLCVEGVPRGARQKLAIRTGLPSADGESIRKPVEIGFYVRDRAPSVRFVGRAYVLPRSADAAIPVVTVNLSEVEIAIHRIGERGLIPAIQGDLFDQAINRWREEQLAGQLGEAIWTGTAEVRGEVNEDAMTSLPVGDAIQTFEPGVYAMTARVPGDTSRWDRVPTQWFIVTDLGLASMSAADGLHGFVRTLSSADPIAGAEVRLVARNNDILGTATTDAMGYVHFASGLTRGTGGAAPAVLGVEHGGDFAFIDLSKPGFDLSDRGVEGRAAPGPVDVFATTERGVYRPGEVVHITALARDGAANAISDLPLTAVVTRPDGVEYHRSVLGDQGAGGRSLSVRLGTGAPRGTWSLKLHTDPKAGPVAQKTFLVEDFVPERIAFNLDAPDGAVRRTDPITVSLTARYLYGAPAGDLPVEGTVRLLSTDTLPGYKGFSFGLASEEAINIADSLPGSTTDPNGNAVVTLPVPDAGDATKPQSLTAIVHVTDSSGRPVERTLTRPVAPDGTRIGIRPLFEGQVEEGSIAQFELIAVGPDLARTALSKVGWTLSHIDRDWQWYELDGRWNYEAITSRERVASDTVSLSADGRLVVEAPVEWGEYELKVVNLDGTFTASSVKIQCRLVHRRHRYRYARYP